MRHTFSSRSSGDSRGHPKNYRRHGSKYCIDSESPILAEPEIIEEPESKVVENPKPEAEVEEPEQEVEEPLIGTHVDLVVESTIKLTPSLTAIFLRSPDVYDKLQIFLHKI